MDADTFTFTKVPRVHKGEPVGQEWLGEYSKTRRYSKIGVVNDLPQIPKMLVMLLNMCVAQKFVKH